MFLIFFFIQRILNMAKIILTIIVNFNILNMDLMTENIKSKKY